MLEYFENIDKIGNEYICKDRSNPHDEFIGIIPEHNAIGFQLQKGPKKDGVNGCGVDSLLEVAKVILNGKLKSELSKSEKHNLSIGLMHLDTVLYWVRKVEG